MPSAPRFLRLDDLLLPPALSAAAAIALLFGLFELGLGLSRRLRGREWEPLDGAAGLILVTGLVGALVHGAACAELASLPWLRALAAGVGLFGAASLVRLPARSRDLRAAAERWWQGTNGWERLLVALLALIVLSLALAALGPATDADSLDYHLGVPLDWLRHGGAYPRPDWFHARLVGDGEGLDLLGLAAGSDCFGAVLQLAGLAVAAVTACSLHANARARLLAALLVLATPLILSLVPAQKPMLLPAAATLLSLALLARRRERLDRTTILFALAGAAFAAGCKYSFLMSGALVLATTLWLAARERRFAAASAILLLLLFTLPIYLRNYLFYGDPLSPFLERLRPHPDPALLLFASYLRDYGGVRSLTQLVSLPWTFSFFRPPTGALGIGFLAALGAPWRDRRFWPLLVPGAALFFILAGTAQLTPRFFLEPYLWIASALPASRWRPFAVLSPLLGLQASLVAGGALYVMAQSVAGLPSRAARERLLDRVAPGATEARWLDESLQPSDVVIAPTRSRLLLPRPFLVTDEIEDTGSAREEEERLSALVRRTGATVLVMPDPVGPEVPTALREAAARAEPIGQPRSFETAVRTPLIPIERFSLRLYRLAPTPQRAGD